MTKRLAVILIDKFADWEFGYLTSTVRDWLKGTVTFHTPAGNEVTSEGGLRAASDGAIEDLKATDFDALAVIGSGQWSKTGAPDISDLLISADKSHKVLGFICQGTLAAARAGLLDTRPHSSNDSDTPKMVPTYQGAAHYVDTPRALRSDNIVTASGLAPVTFAIEMLMAMYPDKEKELAGFRADCAREHMV